MENNSFTLSNNKRLIIILTIAALLLAIPFIAMQFSTEMAWTPSDFVKAGVLLFGTGLACELVLRNVKSLKYRFLICAAILFALFLIWVELAVGLFGTPFTGS